MSFAAGVVAGLVVAALAGLIVFRARVIAGRPSPRYLDVRALIAVAALVVSVIALVRSDNSVSGQATPADPNSSATVNTDGSASTPTSPVSSSTSTSVGFSEVTVPNVVGLTQADATAKLQKAGLRAHVQTLPLNSVPAGFVVSQTPLAFSTTTSNAIVILSISAAA